MHCRSHVSDADIRASSFEPAPATLRASGGWGGRGDGGAGDRDDRRILAAGAGPERAAVRDAPGALPQELARTGITEMDAANEFLQDFWPRFNASFAVAPEEPESAFSPLLPSMKAKLPDVLCLEDRADGRQRQRRLIQGQGAPDPAPTPPSPLRAGQGLRPRVRGRRDGRLPRDPEAAALRCEGKAAGQGRGGCVRASAPLLGSLRSPRRAAEPETGHFTCSENRTFYLLPTWTRQELTPGRGPLPSALRLISTFHISSDYEMHREVHGVPHLLVVKAHSQPNPHEPSNKRILLPCKEVPQDPATSATRSRPKEPANHSRRRPSRHLPFRIRGRPVRGMRWRSRVAGGLGYRGRRDACPSIDAISTRGRVRVGPLAVLRLHLAPVAVARLAGRESRPVHAGSFKISSAMGAAPSGTAPGFGDPFDACGVSAAAGRADLLGRIAGLSVAPVVRPTGEPTSLGNTRHDPRTNDRTHGVRLGAFSIPQPNTDPTLNHGGTRWNPRPESVGYSREPGWA